MRLLRRLRVTSSERKRTVESVLDQYERHVRNDASGIRGADQNATPISSSLTAGKTRAALDMLNALISGKVLDENPLSTGIDVSLLPGPEPFKHQVGI